MSMLMRVPSNLVQSIRAYRVPELQEEAARLGHHFLYAHCANTLTKQQVCARIGENFYFTKPCSKNFEALKTVARIRSALGEKQKALDALRASFFISPFDYKLHTQAGELSLELKDYPQALTEFQVALALQPPNIAEANYNVATAFHALGRQREAKRSVLRALEAAPRYEKAQELLLRITGQ